MLEATISNLMCYFMVYKAIASGLFLSTFSLLQFEVNAECVWKNCNALSRRASLELSLGDLLLKN
jgi:hypothetical protein